MSNKLMAWIDERLPVSNFVKNHLSQYYAPKNFNFFYYFGALAIFIFVLQIVTGIFLTINYKPDAAQVTNSSVALSSIPQSTYGMNQSNIAESGIAVAGYQSKVNPTALYGSENQAYNQFLKMLGPQPQQMRS